MLPSRAVEPNVGLSPALLGGCQQFEVAVSSDFLWAFFCIIAVWIYMSIHLQSLMLATVGMYQIVISYPVAFFFYKAIFQVTSLKAPYLSQTQYMHSVSSLELEGNIIQPSQYLYGFWSFVDCNL